LHDVFVYQLLRRNVSASVLDHLQGAHDCLDMSSLCVKFYLGFMFV